MAISITVDMTKGQLHLTIDLNVFPDQKHSEFSEWANAWFSHPENLDVPMEIQQFENTVRFYVTEAKTWGRRQIKRALITFCEDFGFHFNPSQPDAWGRPSAGMHPNNLHIGSYDRRNGCEYYTLQKKNTIA